jgi:hypothetical protein
MIATKTSLLRTLRSLAAFDPKGTPFVGLQSRGVPLFHRSSPNGYLQSKGYHLAAPSTVVSLAHMQDCIRAMQDEQIKLSRDDNGTLRLQSVDTTFTDDLRVHTVRDTSAWCKRHVVSSETDSKLLDPKMFAGVSISPFQLSVPPVLRRDRMMLATDHGIVMRTDIPSLDTVYPRAVFLQALPADMTALHLTANGYWVARSETMELAVAGHGVGNQVFEMYDTSAETEATFPAARFLFALSAASGLCGEGSRIQWSPQRGISTEDQFRNPASFSIGDMPNFSPVSIPAKTADVISAALSQSTDEVILLGRTAQGIRRVTRGQWSVSFRADSSI